jgi:Zn-dependent peptidase ImmA (M78 family)
VAEKRRYTEVSPYAEVNLARRLIKKNGLTPPINALALVEERAEVIITHIPVPGVDGVSVDIKVPGKTPKVILNSGAPATRQLFTLAHELGHLLIAWHTGTLPDMLDMSWLSLDSQHLGQASNNLPTHGDYWQMEQEANRFASELLMPESWVLSLIDTISDLAELHEALCKQAKVSPWAACIKLQSLLPAGIVYCCAESDADVTFSGRTDGTMQSVLPRGAFEPDETYTRALQHFSWVNSYNVYHWWRFPTEVSIVDSDPRDWRTLLDDIINEAGPLDTGLAKTRHIINSVIASAHGSVINNRALPYTEESIIAACIQRTLNREDLTPYYKHPDFKLVIKKRAAELYVARLTK